MSWPWYRRKSDPLVFLLLFESLCSITPQHVIGVTVTSLVLHHGRHALSQFRETPAPLSSPGLERTMEGSSVPNENSAFPRDKRVLVSRRSLSGRCYSVVSSFLDKNAGLMIAASQLFLSASNHCAKCLNGLDKHVPILEVRCAPG
jgi:hypothetical protein